MWLRVVTSLVGLAVFFAVVAAGQAAFTVAISIVTVGMLIEMYSTIKSKAVLTVTGFVSAALILVSIIFGTFTTGTAAVFSIFIYLAVMVICHTKITYAEAGTHAFVTFFITMFFGTNIRIFAEFGFAVMLLVFISAWATDTGAYFSGRAFGKHKLAPNLSPKKTVEGAVGGIVSAAVCCVIYLLIMKTAGAPLSINYGEAAVIGACASVFSQTGDLVASAVKRDCGVKDFGNILPGHGGILDRFDSVVYVTPVIYYLFVLLSK